MPYGVPFALTFRSENRVRPEIFPSAILPRNPRVSEYEWPFTVEWDSYQKNERTSNHPWSTRKPPSQTSETTPGCGINSLKIMLEKLLDLNHYRKLQSFKGTLDKNQTESSSELRSAIAFTSECLAQISTGANHVTWFTGQLPPRADGYKWQPAPCWPPVKAIAWGTPTLYPPNSWHTTFPTAKATEVEFTGRR